MLRILIVEDIPEKFQHILSTLKTVPGCENPTVDYAHDAIESKRLLEQNSYDLMILDISIPERAGEQPSPEGGIRLLEELIEREIYMQPREIVGLTAYPEVRDKASVRFAEDLWIVLQYDPSSEAWSDQLKRKVRHIIVSKRDEQRPALSDLCLVAALQDPELTAVLELPWKWSIADVQNDGSIYYRGEFQSRTGRRTVFAAAASRMGMSAAAVIASKMIYTFRPRYIGMVGIAAGIKNECDIGDVIVADPSWDYGAGKYRVRDGELEFLAAPHQLSLNSYIRGKLALLARDHAGLARIQHGWRGAMPHNALRLHIGPVASGSAVRQDGLIAGEIRRQHRKVIGIEMETYGVFSAVDDSPLPQPKAFSFKAVSDFADDDKSDDFQAYAAYASANAMKLFVETYL